MIYKRFKDIRLSRLGMGNMRLPIMEGGKAGDIDREKARQIIDYAMASCLAHATRLESRCIRPAPPVATAAMTALQR